MQRVNYCVKRKMTENYLEKYFSSFVGSFMIERDDACLDTFLKWFCR